jgi:ABC-type nitrate/sulfonate/bicarbonate transport system substrate-binding protein
MKKIITGLILIIVAFGLFFLFSSRNIGSQIQPSSINDSIVLRLPDTKFMGILPLYIAEEKGFFEQEKIKVQWVDVKDPGQAEKLFHSSQVDLIMTTFANLLPAEVRKPGTLRLLFPIFESSDKPGSFILAQGNSEIKGVNDLRGKTLGTYSGASQRTYALLFLKKIGLREPEDVRLVQVPSSAQVQGLLGGSFDALFAVEPYGSLAISKGAKVIELGIRTKYIFDPFWLGSVAISSALAKEKPQVITGILNSLERAATFIKESETESREILAKRTNIDKIVAEKCALYTWVAHPTNLHIKEIQAHVETLFDEKLLENKVSMVELFEGLKEK